MRILGRLGALILGLLGVVIGFIANLVGVANAHFFDTTGATQSHGILGILFVIVGLIGSVLALFSPIVAAILLLIAGVGFFFVFGVPALLVSIPFILAAVLAYIDRRPAEAR